VLRHTPSGSGHIRKQKGLLDSDESTNVMHENVSGVHGFYKNVLMHLASSKQKDVICKNAGSCTEGFGQVDPRSKVAGDERHAKWTALRNATGVGVGSTEATCNAVSECHVIMKAGISSKQTRGATSMPEHGNDEGSGDLVKGFVDVSDGTRNFQLRHLGFLKV
jgi:hypothetical protein